MNYIDIIYIYIYIVIYIVIYIYKDFPKERYCTCVYLCNLIIRYGHLEVLVR